MTPTYLVTACYYDTCQVEAANESEAVSKAQSCLRCGLIWDEFEVEQLDDDEDCNFYEDDDIEWNTPEHE